MSYDALVLDDELKDALQNVMDKDSLDVETLQGFTLNTHSGTGIQYLVKDGEEGRGGKVLLQNEADRKRYEELAEMYFDKYPNLIESREEGFIWADLEIRGMAKRTDQGIISIGADGMSYSDNENYKNNWSVRFSGSCMKSCMNGFRITRIAWRKSINFLHGKRFLTKLVERMKESGRKKNWIRDI